MEISELPYQLQAPYEPITKGKWSCIRLLGTRLTQYQIISIKAFKIPFPC